MGRFYVGTDYVFGATQMNVLGIGLLTPMPLLPGAWSCCNWARPAVPESKAPKLACNRIVVCKLLSCCRDTGLSVSMLGLDLSAGKVVENLAVPIYLAEEDR